MHRSKLELYAEVLQVLAKKPQTIDSIAYACNMDCINLSQRLAFLVKNGLIQQGTLKNKTAYALTKRGLAISETLAITRRLEKLQPSTKRLDALQTLSASTENSKGKAKQSR